VSEDEDRLPPAHPDFASHFTSKFYDADDLENGDAPPFGSDAQWDGVYEWAGRIDDLRDHPTLRHMLRGSPHDQRAEDYPDLDSQDVDDMVINQGFTLLRYTGQIDPEGHQWLMEALHRQNERFRDAAYETMIGDLMTTPTRSAQPRALAVPSPFDLTGRTALITGGNQGLGKAFAFGLAAAGARVAISGRRGTANDAAVAEAAALGHEFVSITADITDDSQVTRMTEHALDAFDGRLDVLVNNAGTCYHAPSFDVTDEQWSAVFDLNVRALWKTSLAVGRAMREQGSGSIINIGSLSGIIVNRPQWQPAYNASKAAVHHLTKSLAVEWAPHGIRVNAVAPGYVQTDMAPVDRPEFQRYWIEDTPQQRFALPEEIAPSVVFLASDAASFITGSILVADGGYTAV
jgi:NAD(P)-dependent dehydrogenase (short-subunit alcohol dehydrogenase family)